MEKRRLEESIDDRVATFLQRDSQRLSRRGMLRKMGSVLLRLSGLTLIPLLPIDRRFQVSAVTHHCRWQTCGMCGNVCSTTCCGGGGSLYACPSCSGRMHKDGAWGGCCYDSCTTNCTGGTSFMYADCCATNTTDQSMCKSAEFCGHGCPRTDYCYNGRFYSCTIIVTVGPMSCC